MRLYDTTLPHRSLIHEVWSWCDANITSYPLKDVIRCINIAYEQVVSWLINADGTWQFDDSLYTAFPIGTYTLIASQAKYSFNDKFLQLSEVQIMNKSGDYVIIPSIDQKEYSDETPLEEAYETAGMPQYYDKVSDDTIKLFPAPDNGVSVTLASGLKIKFKRTARLYTMSDSTTITSGEEAYEPGFASPYHIILAWMAARPYCMKYKKDRVAELNALIGDTTLIPTGMKKELINHYSRREKDKRKQMSMKNIKFR